MQNEKHGNEGTGERLLSLREVAARLGVCQRTVTRLAQSGAFRLVKVGAAVRIFGSDLEAYFERLRAGGLCE